MNRAISNIIWFSAFSLIVFPFLLAGQVKATVTGNCSNCHTMHNSQDGGGMVADPLEGSSGGGDCQGCHSQPREELLTLTCIGCHAKDSDGPPIDSPDTMRIPQVFYGDSGSELAAGNFRYVVLGGEYGESYGHNVHGWGIDDGEGDWIMPDGTIISPPGYEDGMNPSDYEYWQSSPLAAPMVLCAGAYGCHGDRDIESQTKATAGTHHADDSVLRLQQSSFNPAEQGQTPGTSYRYLNGVKGGEISDWEETVNSNSHNEYYGKDITERSDQSSVETMSEFCASCHGNFHMAGLDDGRGINTGGTTSPWIRHPTDVKIPDEAPYNNYVTYELTARVARVDLIAAKADTSRTQIGTGNAVVFCLSCHKAHASKYPDMLRFSYDNMLTGEAGAAAGTGCFACHTDKDGE